MDMRKLRMMTHNNQIKKEAVCYTPACEWPAAIFSQASVPQTAPIITGVMRLLVGQCNDSRS